MAKLHAKPIDLMQVHNLLDVETHLATLSALKRERRVRHIGVTHYTASAYDAVAKIIAKHSVDTVQINYSIGEREAEQRLLPLARDRGIAVIVNRPFAGGELFRRLRATPIPAWAVEINCTSWAQLMLKFVISHPGVTCANPEPADSNTCATTWRQVSGYCRMKKCERKLPPVPLSLRGNFFAKHLIFQRQTPHPIGLFLHFQHK